MVILKFYVINTSDNLPFQPYYSGLYTISYQKMHIASLVQFMSKKSSLTGPCEKKRKCLSIDYTDCTLNNQTSSIKPCVNFLKKMKYEC